MKESDDEVFNEGFEQTVALGNDIAAQDSEADVWDIADGMLAGAIQYWLYSRQPCGNPQCEDCASMATAEARMSELLRLIKEAAKDSEYYHSPSDANVGRA